MEHEHTPEAIRERLAAGPGHSYLRDFVYGGIDGAVTTFAVVSGVVGAQLAPRIIIILGVANLVADGFSMAAGNYLGTRAEQDDFRHIEAIEHRHIDTDPEGEREEVRQIFADKGFGGEDLTRVVDLITSNRRVWVRTMLTEEYGLPHDIRSPWMAAMTTFGAFVLCGSLPLIPFFFGLANAFQVAAILVGGVFFAIGSFKSMWSTSPWWRSGLSTLAVGGIAAALAYVFGVLLKGLA
ncbi:MAG TPA: VIT1/CCC1 transporter family protein [Blastocatellia bacterium]|jgi:VIT1/CCC1 family predicted Fe2+/Mn2+ transporter|nr:VIT1/CCC1 transporter family protein [Blastocatellia bacterium]